MKKKTYITATDQFCGAGGSTTGAKYAGVEVKMALNHWKLAVETHNTNHPDTDHDCTDIQACDPRRYPSTDILITSPECTNHSLAKGRKRKYQNQGNLFEKHILPEEERSRATMWDVPRFAEFHDYNIIVVENVVDARYWRLWDAWLKAMNDLGYDHTCLYLNSMFFHPCPQSRDRMYVVFWKRGNKAPDLEFRPLAPCPRCGDKEAYQAWKPGRKWGKYKMQYVYRCSECNDEVTPYYYAAANAIDWGTPGQKIGDRERPLSPKTMERIQRGIEKFSIPFFINSEYNKQPKTAAEPFWTQTTHDKSGVVFPFIVTTRYSSGVDCRIRGMSDSFPTQPGDQAHGICFPNHMLETAVEPFIVNMKGNCDASSLCNPASTVLAGGNHHMLVGNYSPGWVRPIAREAGTVTTITQQYLLSMPYFLSYYYSSSAIVSGMAESVGTITTKERVALVNHQPKIEDCMYRMLHPGEIQAVMSFPDDYIILGNRREKVKQLGNAVTPPVMQWIMSKIVKSLS